MAVRAPLEMPYGKMNHEHYDHQAHQQATTLLALKIPAAQYLPCDLDRFVLATRRRQAAPRSRKGLSFDIVLRTATKNTLQSAATQMTKYARSVYTHDAHICVHTRAHNELNMRLRLLLCCKCPSITVFERHNCRHIVIYCAHAPALMLPDVKKYDKLK